MSSAATSARTIHGTSSLASPASWIQAWKKTPVAASEATVKKPYAPSMANPPKNPARGPMVAPASA